jgi:hypothetical protein
MLSLSLSVHASLCLHALSLHSLSVSPCSLCPSMLSLSLHALMGVLSRDTLGARSLMGVLWVRRVSRWVCSRHESSDALTGVLAVAMLSWVSGLGVPMLSRVSWASRCPHGCLAWACSHGCAGRRDALTGVLGVSMLSRVSWVSRCSHGRLAWVSRCSHGCAFSMRSVPAPRRQRENGETERDAWSLRLAVPRRHATPLPHGRPGATSCTPPAG